MARIFGKALLAALVAAGTLVAAPAQAQDKPSGTLSIAWRWDPATGRQEFLHPPSEGEALLDAAARVKSPVVLVRAELSHLLTDEGVAEFQRLAPQLEVVIARGVGHMFTADRNDGFAAELLDRLDQIAEGTL